MKSKSIFCLIFLAIAYGDSLFAQPFQVAEGFLPNDCGMNEVPVFRFEDTLFLEIIPWSDSGIKGYQKFPHQPYPSNWWQRFYWHPSYMDWQHTEFTVSSTGFTYIYYSDGFFYYNLTGEQWQVRENIRGRPLMDNYNNFHVIWKRQENTDYAFSTDTLASYEQIQNLNSLPPFVRLVSSPDNAILGALFHQNDTLYKYLTSNGEPFDFSEAPITSYFDYRPTASFDITLDFNGEIYIACNVCTTQSYWGDHYAWSERWGWRYLEPSGDDVLTCTNFEFIFGPDEGEIILIESSGPQTFFITFNGGNIWNSLEYFSILGNVGHLSAPRIYDDTIDFVYSTDHVYYHPFNRDSLIGLFTGIDDNNVIPDRFALKNYPNPFNGKTIIAYSIPEPQHVKLKIYDVLGRQVQTLVDKFLEAGSYIAIFDASGLASGIYFCRLDTGEFNKIKQMILLK
jgi:hypothetical protein